MDGKGYGGSGGYNGGNPGDNGGNPGVAIFEFV